MDLNNLEKTIENIKIAFNRTYAEDILKEKISKIKDVYISSWEKENLEFLKEVYNKTSIDNGFPVPVLTVCGKGTKEIRFTKYLGYYLDPNNYHGLQYKFLKAILNQKCKEADFRDDWHENCKVESEYYLGKSTINAKKFSGTVDIAIWDYDFFIAIENKILSGESDHPDLNLNQLERYNELISNNSDLKDKKTIKIYLKPGLNNEKNKSGWSPLSYEYIINRGIKILDESKLSLTARENLARLLIDLAIGPFNKVSDSLLEINRLAKELLEEGFMLQKSIKFDRLTSEHERILKIL